MMQPYPRIMAEHGPARSLEDYLEWLYGEVANAPDARPGTARARDLAARIHAIEDELNARAKL